MENKNDEKSNSNQDASVIENVNQNQCSDKNLPNNSELLLNTENISLYENTEGVLDNTNAIAEDKPDESTNLNLQLFGAFNDTYTTTTVTITITDTDNDDIVISVATSDSSEKTIINNNENVENNALPNNKNSNISDSSNGNSDSITFQNKITNADCYGLVFAASILKNDILMSEDCDVTANDIGCGIKGGNHETCTNIIETISQQKEDEIKTCTEVAVAKTENELEESRTVSTPVSIPSVVSLACRICHSNEQTERLISPCLCKGTIAYIHQNCLEHWLSTSGITHCELCYYEFSTIKKRRYKLLEAIKVWYSQSNNKELLKIDLLVISFMTLASIGLTILGSYGFHSYVSKDKTKNARLDNMLPKVSILLFMIVVVIVYVVNLSLIIKSQLAPLIRWWTTTYYITVVMDEKNDEKCQKQNEESTLKKRLLKIENDNSVPASEQDSINNGNNNECD